MIAFFVISTELGGAERSLLAHLKNSKLKKKLVVVPRKTGALINELNDLSIPWLHLAMPRWILKISRKYPIQFLLFIPITMFFSFYYLIRINLAVKQNQITHIHSTGIKYHILLGLYGILTSKVNLVIHLRDIIHSSLLKSFFSVIAHRKNITLLSNSKATARSIAPTASEVIYNGFDLEISNDRSSYLHNLLNISHDQKIVGIIGVIARWKGQREFLQMAQTLSQHRKDLNFVVVGDEIYDTIAELGELKNLQQMADDLGIKSKVHFIGFQKTVKPIYQSLDVLVHSSIKPEPFGRVIVEAMSLGCPVTASKQGGPLEIINHQQNGLLHQAHSVDQRAQNVLRLIEDQPLREKIITNALQTAQSFGIDSYVKNMDFHLMK